MIATTETTIRCQLENGDEAELTMKDCAQIINAMARRHLLDVCLEELPSDYESLWTQQCVAVARDMKDEYIDEGVMLFANCEDFTSATPRPAKRSKKK
jgi:hypothetical protein